MRNHLQNKIEGLETCQDKPSIHNFENIIWVCSKNIHGISGLCDEFAHNS